MTGYDQVVEELSSLTGSLTVRRVYLYGLDLISQDQLFPNPTGGETWQTTFYHYNGLGSVRALSRTDGLTTDAYWYDAYGVLINVVGTTPNAYLYTGEQWDADLGMYFLRARYMEPGSGRFWTMDTYEGRGADPATLHKYLYVHGNPLMFIDPSGKSFIMNVGVVMAITLMVAATFVFPHPFQVSGHEPGDCQIEAHRNWSTHEFIYYPRGGYIGFYPAGWNPLADPDGYVKKEGGPGDRVWNLERKTGCQIADGVAKGRLVETVDCSGIYDCIGAVNRDWDNRHYALCEFPILGHGANCRGFVDDVMSRCGLRRTRTEFSPPPNMGPPTRG